ncbi:MAG: SBBP repeat-containing protein [Lewinellaceae bacterium]|nr:SBBP repeat-containing protein [Lewinellaceae bacterium]
MKNIAISIVISIATLTQALAQPTLQWDKRFHGPIAHDEGKAITVDAAGFVYVTGSSDAPTGATGFLTIKYDSKGDTVWTRRYEGAAPGLAGGRAIHVDGSGNVYVTGSIQGASSGADILTIKYGATGVQLWASVYKGSTTSKDIGYNLVVDVFGNVYVVGSSGWSAVALKYNAMGMQQWIAGSGAWYDPITPETEYHIDINHLNNIVITLDDPDAIGNFEAWELNGLNGSHIFTYNQPFVQLFWGSPNAMALNSNGDIFMLSTEYNSSGTPKEINVSKFTYGIKTATWKVSYTADRIYGVDLKIDADNNVYVLASQFIQGTYNYFTIKYNSEGNYEWGILYYNQDRDNIPVALALSDITDPDIFVAGYSSKGEITTVGYDNDSSPLWNAVVYDCGNNGPDIAAALAIDACDNLYIAGNSNCNNTFRDFQNPKYAATPAPVITPASPVSICEGSSATLNSSAAMSHLWSTGATTDSIVVSTASMYTVTVTYADGCTAVSKTTNVVVNPLPTASINADKPTICQGESAVLTANTCSGCSYLWNTGETTPVNTVMPLMSTNYTVTVTTAAGCSAASAPLTITVNTVPVVTAAVTGPDTICIGEMTQLSASGATTYNWVPAIGLDDPTSPNPGASPISTTTYTVNGTTAGCSATAFVTVTVFSAPGQPGSINGNISACSGSVQVYSVPEVAGVTYDWVLPAGWTGTQNNNSITVTAGQMSGTISVIARNDCGDSPPRTLVVTIITPPAKPVVINGPVSICAGSMHWYSVDAVAGATSYEWVSPQGWTGTSSSDSIFLTAGDNGGTIFIIANNTCGSSSPQMLAVSVEPLPTVEFPMDTIMLLPGQQLTPQIMGDVTSYLWSTNETIMSIAVDSIPMVYTVTVFTSTGCSATASVFVDIKTISTVNKGDPGLLQISPNPASDIINIRCTEAATQLVQLVNLHGQVLVQDETYVPSGEIRQVDIGQAPLGLYFLRIFGKRQYWAVPVVKTD